MRPAHAASVGLWVAAFTLLGAAAPAPEAESASGSSALERFFTRPEQPLTEYRGYRRMHAWSEKFSHEAWLEAWTELDHGRFRYRIVNERGSDTIRNRVLRPLLEHEQQLVNSGDAPRADLTPENYDFKEGGRDADGSRYVDIKPRRKDVLLVDGRMVLSPDGRDLLRVEGRLARNPSFWTSLVNIVRRYARIGGVRVPVATETTAKVRFAGTAQLEVHYEYESVNGRPVTLAERR
jgi:hypothetical protein